MEMHSSSIQLRLRAKLSLTILVAALTIPCISASEKCHFPAIFNFGDSNSDTGGLSSAFGPAPPPNGESFFHSPAGRYCDGRLIVDFIAQSLGLPYLHAYLDSIAPNFTHGANFATAGSTIRAQNTTLSQSGFSPIYLDVQFSEFSQFRPRSQKVPQAFKNLYPKEEDFNNSLYTFDIGQNDLTAGYFSGMTTEEVIAAVPDIIKKLTDIIRYIAVQGGRYFWIHNTGPFGCLPYVIERLKLRNPEVDNVGCVSPFNSVAQFFNKKLKEAVVQLRKDLPFASFTYVDIYSVKYDLISKAGKYGFKHPLRACCGYRGKHNDNENVVCGGTVHVNGTAQKVGSCEEPSAAINWDGVHYTQAANEWVFEQIVNGAFSDPPLSLDMACYREAQ